MADEPISDDERIIQNLIAYCEDVPLKILRATSTKQLSQRLDVEGFVLGEYSNDWYGLAERTGYMTKEMRKFEQHESPTTALLNDWSTRLKMSPTVDTLLKYLVEIQRPDVVLDSEKSISTYYFYIELQHTHKNTNTLLIHIKENQINVYYFLVCCIIRILH